MNFKAARTSLAIRIATAIVLAMAAGLVVGGLRDGGQLAAGLLLGIVALACWLLAPASYDVSDGRLTVVLHAGRRPFGRIVGCARVTERPPFTVRLFGNGGLFAGTGIFWNRRYGVFRVHATSARLQDMVLVQAERHKVLVTPEDPQAFVASATAPGAAGE